MTPYADFLFFGVLLYVAVPILAFGLADRLGGTRFWILGTTTVMLLVQYSEPVPSLSGLIPNAATRAVEIVALYALFEWAVAAAFLRRRRRAKSRSAFRAALALGLAPLVAVKFLPLLAPHLAFGFLGISYCTFRALDVVIGIHDGVIAELSGPQYLGFLLFFPTVSSGPVDRYRRFAQDWLGRRTRGEFLRDLDGAVQRLFRGFLYKFILAELIRQHWLDKVAQGKNWCDVLSYMYAYSFHLFFDFAGYSCFAVALSYLLGVHTPENFDRPFLSRNIREFWNRWHISLSWWFRDHVYMRFVFAATRGKWFQNRYTASHLGFLLSMGLMGLWHGPAWHYLLYGLYHGALLVGHDLFARWAKGRGRPEPGRLQTALSIAITFQAVCFGLLIFSGRLTTPAPGVSEFDFPALR